MSQKDAAFNEKEIQCKSDNLREKVPYKLFGKRIFKTSGRLVASTQLLQNPVPTQDCDIIVTFPRNADTSTLMWLLDRLRSRSSDIIVHVRHHSNTKEAVFHLTATYESLLKGAEDVSIKKMLKEEYGGGMKEFTFEEQDCFAGVEDENTFFTTQERQSIISNMLNDLRAIKGEQLNKVKFLEGQPIVPLLQSKGIVSQVFPLHHQDSLQELRKGWVQGLFKRQPLDKIKDYYGVKIAMYFAYLGHYTMALCIPAFLGAGIWLFQGEDETYDDQWFVAFALFNAFWATLYLEHWKRRSSELAYNWGTLDKMDELLEDPRPLFTGSLQESPVTGRLEPHYSAWKRNLFRYFISLPIICLCLCVVFIVMLLIFQLQEWTNSLVKSEDIPGFFKFLPKILLAISIGILDEVYKKIAYWLNDKENYRLDDTYENHLIIKLALFQFVNSFLSLFYIAFYLQDMDRLRDQLAAILITRQVIGNIKEALLPYLLWRAKLYKVGFQMTSDLTPSSPSEKIISVTASDKSGELRERKKDDSNKEESNAAGTSDINKPKNLSLTQGEVESTMKKYEDTFEDYLEMFIQFGYVTLFSSAFPLAALCALLNNVVEVRSDAFKLCMNHQRPFGKQVENIGTWQDALELMGVIAVIVNCALIGVSGQVNRLVPNSSIVLTVLLIVALEHIILMLKFILAYAIPDVPERIATKKARLEFLRREALKKLESQISPSSSSDIKHKQKYKTEGRSYCQTVTANCSQKIGDFRLITPTELPTRSSPQIISITGSGADQKSTQIPIPAQGSLIIKTPVKTTSTYVSKVTIGPRKNVTSSANISSSSMITTSPKSESPSRDNVPKNKSYSVRDSVDAGSSVDGFSNSYSVGKSSDSKIPVPVPGSSSV